MKILGNFRWGASLLIPIFLLGSCDSLLDVEPESQISEALFWKTDKDVNSGVAAIYDAAQKAYGKKYFIWGELRSDNFQPIPSGNNDAGLQLMTNGLTDQNEDVSGWTNIYNMILKANIAINAIKANDISGDIDNYLGQAHALRAFAYFDLVRAYGDVPLYLEQITGVNDNIFREKTSGEQIMQEVIIPDMLEAERLITTQKDKATFSKAAVYCLQAEIYMYLGENQKAKDCLDKLEAFNDYSLTSEPLEFHALFRNELPSAEVPEDLQENGPELIFSIVYNIDEDLNQAGIYGIFWPGTPTYGISALLEEKWLSTFPSDSAEFVTKYPDFTVVNKDEEGNLMYGDYQRFGQLIEEAKIPGERRYAKYNTTNYPTRDDDTDIVVYRYGGMLLLKAEAEAKLGNSQAAVDLVNRIRAARQLPQINIADYPTQEAVLNVVLDERQFELFAEGERWHDLRRNNKAVEVLGPINGQTEDKLLFPIFFEHLVENPNLTQTEGY
ncbi:RagB/SusD family nutrient uptake outer membrane protein [Flammeovirga sp. OC4]|uniref:RagB/SusD family nutrient uptake outer membrane protein n=1 Tax=Flammeovirga sp. OC4 TaxID=1382345 RepID=UPI0005C7451F|nr:RagB/SusD family nutrient uptake outer membrane protein [Flammeovirga sp. OC4]